MTLSCPVARYRLTRNASGFAIRALIFFGVIALLSSGTRAMVEEISPQQLVASSVLIVNGQYLGRQSVKLGEREIFVGVISVIATLKGEASDVVLLRDSDPTHVLTDRLQLQKGMTGLWFLAPPFTLDGVTLYQVIDPQRFVPMERAGAYSQWLDQ